MWLCTMLDASRLERNAVVKNLIYKTVFKMADVGNVTYNPAAIATAYGIARLLPLPKYKLLSDLKRKIIG